MAWEKVQCSECGKEFRVQIYGPHKDREWKVNHFYWLCDECKAKKREEEAKEAAERSREMELTELEGSEKQIQWALKIRLQAIKEMEKQIEREKNMAEIDPDGDPEKAERLIMLGIQEVLKETRASWWIDRRGDDFGYIASKMGEKFQNAPEVTGKYIEAEEKREAKAEATVRPTNAVTDNVAEIAFTNDTVTISFPEKREDFRKTIRGLYFTWDKEHLLWKRHINSFNGPAKDRIAEAGNKILSIGIPIRIFDKEIRNAAINADFYPEQTRWIVENTNTGWFGIAWDRKNEDFYEQARKIPGSRYDRDTRSVLVPPESFQEVLDFADMYNFCLSEKAQVIADKAREDKEKSLIVDSAEAKSIKKNKPKSKPEPLEIPKDENIDEELRDDN